MDQMKTFSLLRHSRLFSVPDSKKDYLFVGSSDHPYYEEPYRAESYAIAYIKEGGVRLNAGLSSWEVQAPAIITLGPSVIRYFTKNSEHLKMDVIFFKDSFLLERYADLFFLFKYDFFGNNGLHVLPLKESYYTKINTIYELIQLTQLAGGYHESELVRNYIFALVYELDSYYRQLSSEASSSLNDQHPLFTKFRKLLNANYMTEHKLDFYANQLYLTPKSLSAAIKKYTGKSAGKWIDDAIILEAKVLLQNKTLTVSQISGMLNFSDQSVFGKFFRANTGVSPIEYRKRF
ncbi:AraC family transcriptional activator of pobA [Chryseobacterium ginsenosidimutans]|uniref:helix-turn-helix domain-containing protein n=1 Tax=Chryseobacterium ginsenosidimutans TaxID=687846 RepID=UPI0027873B05|nr:helix-turn-helix domain-containing protein [Chryseobacterium ginsenosidimutans]MDQ0593623.1 AraC family transcriptional activator of pobA [Chryseobacterium ginsenosidimutans]